MGQEIHTCSGPVDSTLIEGHVVAEDQQAVEGSATACSCRAARNPGTSYIVLLRAAKILTAEYNGAMARCQAAAYCTATMRHLRWSLRFTAL